MITRRRGTIRRLPASFYEFASELALIGLSLATLYTFARLFADASFFMPVAAAVVAAHIIAAAIRWAGGGIPIATIASVAGLVGTAAVLFPPTTVETTALLNQDVLVGFFDDLRLGGEQFQSVSAPAEVTAPFLLIIAIVMWVVAFLGDWAAFRLRAPVEAVVPGLAVFVFGAFFAADQARVQTSIVFVGAALAFVLIHRLAEAETAGAWLGQRAAQRGQASLLRVGLGVIVATMLGGVAAAQALPGYEEPAIFDPTELAMPEEPRVVLSPLVDIQAGLVDQPDVEVFTVQTDNPDYWRITSLDVFDGRIWRSRGSFDNAGGDLAPTLPDGTAVRQELQTFDIRALGKIWLPAAYEPSEIVSIPDGLELEYERASGTLIVNRDRTNSDGLTYTLLSNVPQRELAAIQDAGSAIPDEIADRYLELPDDFSERVRQEARDIVDAAGAQTPYSQALALQNYFRDPARFRYDLDVAQGHSAERIEDFLFEVRAGYCEQFAGSYAAMARALGLPSRVAVGFTPGEYDPEIDAYRVTGKHAHAWPEVWIEDIGWLRFEPTPGRGAPGDEAHTGFPPDQEGASPASDGTDEAGSSLAVPDAAAPSTTVPSEQQQGVAPTTTIAPDIETGTTVIGDGQGVSTTTIAVWLLSLVALTIVVGTPLLYGMWRARRQLRAVADDPRGRIGLAWSNTLAALEFMGFSADPSKTPSEVVAEVAEADDDAAEELRPLATAVVRATYGGQDAVSGDGAAAAEQITETIAARAKEKRGGLEWWWHHASPVTVWRDRSGVWGHLRPQG